MHKVLFSIKTMFKNGIPTAPIPKAKLSVQRCLLVSRCHCATHSSVQCQRLVTSDYTQIELGLLPNLANKADQLQNSYNINTANLEVDNDLLSYGLIGFRPRQYMTS
jgi:hypothetical protein